MKQSLISISVTLAVCIGAITAPVAAGQVKASDTSKTELRVLTGEFGSSPRWGSGWLDLSTPTDFKSGDVLRLRIGGTALKVVVRLLPKGVAPESSSGILGASVDVPEDREVELEIDADRNNIVQISVHGGSNPWGKFSLGEDNGPASIEYAAVIRGQEVPQSSDDSTSVESIDPVVIPGEIGSSPRWKNGWLDLTTPTDFLAGDVLKLRVAGTANRILVRLLPQGTSPESSTGIVAGPIDVPDNKIVKVALDADRKNIVQISVHGGSNPWGKFPLGEDNGPACVESVLLLRSVSE